jgi:galactokinase
LVVEIVSIHHGTRGLIAASAPGRADFLNTHQDYKGLPVVPAALDLRTYMVASRTGSPGTVEAVSLDLKEKGEEYEDSFRIGENLDYKSRGFFGNYLRAVAKVALVVHRKEALMNDLHGFGLHVTIKSRVPVSAGLASSAALEVCFATVLNNAYGLKLTPKSIAEVAFQAENVELGIPCGRLDQYGSSFGGIALVECKPPFNVRRIPFTDLCLVVADSGIRHSTAEIHPTRQGELNRGLTALLENKSVSRDLRKKISPRFDETAWNEISEEELSPYLTTIDSIAKKRILFTLRMQRSTEIALSIMVDQVKANEMVARMEGVPGLEACLKPLNNRASDSRAYRLRLVGSIMNYQHLLLRDLYDVSLPEIEKIREAMLESEAYGVKISGAGLGGSLIALVGNKRLGKSTLEAGLRGGAEQGWVSSLGTGAHIERVKNPCIQSILKALRV